MSKFFLTSLLACSGLVLGLTPLTSNPSLTSPEYIAPKYHLPQFDRNTTERHQEVASNYGGFLYGAPLLGNSSFFPDGTLGKQRVDADLAAFLVSAANITASIDNERGAVVQKITKAGGLQNLSSFELLYKDEWKHSNPIGIAPGYFTNYSQDLHFSMERLSVNPFSTSRLSPKDPLPFRLDDINVTRISGTDLDSLHKEGRLFFASHSYQARYRLQEGRFGAACDAYFYVHPENNTFLPLAIKTNVGSNLVYSPLDSENDWLLAKMMFNSNDFFHSQIFHLANSHAVAEIVYLAALRTMSARHPVRGFLDRIMYQSYAVRPAGNKTLFNPGGYFDQVAAVDQNAVLDFVGQFYPTVAGLFRSNYLRESLASRCLLDCPYGPKLEHLPFFEDASPIVASLRRFVTTFVNAYYTRKSDNLKNDTEVQAWILEANTKAKVLDFPPAPLNEIETLIDILTQMAYLTGVNHHLLNSNAPSYITGLLPFHPSAFFQPLPTSKGVSNITHYLADLEHAMYQVTLQLRFQRPQLPDEHRELVDMFSQGSFDSDSSGMLPPEVVEAAKTFRSEMEGIGKNVSSKNFDENGLSQGMPFVWKVLDPTKIPYFLCV